MALRVRSAGEAAAKFATRGAAAAGDYKSGVQGSGAAWEQGAGSAGDNFAAGVQEAIGRGAYTKGVRSSGGSYFEQRASTIGANRFADGIRNGQANYAEGIQKSLDVLSKLNLPPRGPKGDARNFERAQMVATALRQAKIGS